MARKIAAKIKREAVRDYHTLGLTLKQVGEKYGVCGESVRRWTGFNARPRGIIYGENVKSEKRRFRKNKTLPNANMHWSKTEDDLLKSAIEDKLSLKDTMSVLGRSSLSISARKRTLIQRGDLPEGSRFNRKRRRRRSSNRLAMNPIPQITKGTEKRENFKLDEFASMVKHHGVTVTLTMGDNGMEIKLHN